MSIMKDVSAILAQEAGVVKLLVVDSIMVSPTAQCLRGNTKLQAYGLHLMWLL
jgi:hypothetical protein